MPNLANLPALSCSGCPPCQHLRSVCKGREAVEREFAKNKELGERLGCWKGGILVEDSQGSVAAALAAQS
jgi:hypothetical protein